MTHRIHYSYRSFLTIIILIFSCTERSGAGVRLGGWAEVSIPAIDGFKISFADSLHGWIVSQNGDIIYTDDAGATWQPRHCPEEIADAALVSSHTGWVRRSVPFGQDTILYKSTDAGISWTVVSLPLHLSFFPSQAAAFVNDSLIFIATDSTNAALLWATTDAGETWSRRGVLTEVLCANIDFFDADVGYAGNQCAGFSPVILLRTTDGGFNWTTIRYFSRYDYIGTFGDFRFFDGRLGCYRSDLQPEIGPPSRGLAMTWNRGESWVGVSNYPATYPAPYRIGMTTDSIHQWLLRYSGSIQRTNDGGATWQEDTLAVPIADILYDLHGHQFALGMGRLFRYDSTVTDVDDSPEAPKEFALFQNYPNPFNPSTKIRFQVMDFGLVTLKVFDVLGREVATLVNERLEPGRHERVFDASGLTSGVYFYRLQAGTSLQVRRSILMK